MATLDIETAKSSRQIELTDLPVEIQRLIARQLVGPGSLWAPRYEDAPSYNEGRLRRKLVEYYGDSTSGSEDLLNWSTCSRHFRESLVPEVFKTIVLRSTPKSMASVRALQNSVIWSHVQELRFAGTWGRVQVSRDPSKWEGAQNKDQYIAQKIQRDMEELAAILENLPPNLSTLSLDFPQGWDFSYMTLVSGGKPWIRIEGGGAVRYDVDRYRALVKRVLSAVSKNDISSKSIFQIKILGLIPMDFSRQLEDELAIFLRNVTSFTLGLCHYSGAHPWFPHDDRGTEYNANTLTAFHSCSSNLRRVYLDHLYRATSLHVLADVSWPLGLEPIHGYNVSIATPFSLPNDPQIMANLSTVFFNQLIVSWDLIDFLVLHSKTLESVELVECFAWVTERQEEDPTHTEAEGLPPRWTHLFEALVLAKPSRLCSFVIRKPCQPFKELIRSPYPDERSIEHEQIHAIMESQTEELNSFTSHRHREHAERRFQMLLPYYKICSMTGAREPAWRSNTRDFIAGHDHNSWLRLVEIMENNLARTLEL